MLTCADASSGRILWQQRLTGNYSASPIHADGRIYYSSEEGVTTVIGGGPMFERLATNRLDEPTLASIAVSNGALFIRSEGHLYKIANATGSNGRSSGR